MSYCADFGIWNSIFAVPSCVVDEYLKIASPCQLKVLLFILRHSGESIETELVSKEIGYAAADVEDALIFWFETGVLKNTNGVLTASEREEEALPAPIVLKEEPQVQAKQKLIPSTPTRPTREECAKLLEDPQLKELVSETQKLFGGMMKRSDIDVLVSLPVWTGLPVSVILMIVTYCCSIGKKSIRYIEKVAISWSEQGIDTLEQADEYITRAAAVNSAWNRVKTIIGIPERRATDREKDFCLKWVDEWKFSDEMIKEAYERCVDSTGKMSMSYINKILERWFRDGIYTKKDISDSEASRQKTDKSNSSGRKRAASYDINDLERKLNEDTFTDWGDS